MACSFAPHNLGQAIDAIVQYIDDNKIDPKILFDILGGPDFPTGGIVINKDELYNGYVTGRGRIRLRGKYHLEKEGKRNPKNIIVFTELPYGTNKEKLITDIADMCNTKKLENITDIRDESDKTGVRLVFEVKNDVDPDIIANLLYSKTQLEITFSINNTCLVDGEPKTLGFHQLIQHYVEHQQDVIRRRSEFDLKKINDRIHILQGLVKALEDIDNIIALIKKSSSAAIAKQELEKKYGFSPIQSKAILDMKLSKLTNLEKVEIENELSELNKESEKLTSIINDTTILNNVLKEELFDIKTHYNDKRRTEITQITPVKEEKEIAFVQPEDVVVVITKAGNVKRIPAKTFKVQNRNGKGIKNQDDVMMDIIATNTIDTLMVFTTFGKMYRILVDDVPVGTNISKGANIKTLIKLEDHEEPIAITSLYRETNAQYVVFVTKNGIIKKTKIEEYTSTKRSGILGLKLKEGDEIAAITFLLDEQMLLITEKGMSIRFNTHDIGAVGRAAIGVIAMKIGEDDKIIAALPVHKDTDDVAIFSKYGLGKKTALSDYPLQGRGGKGTITYKPNDSTGIVVGASLVEDSDNILVVGDQSSICVSAKEIPKLSKAGQGNVIIKNSNVVSVIKI